MSWIARRAPCAWYVVNAQNLASIDLHRAWNFEEVARSEMFHSARFSGGMGVLLRAFFPLEDDDHERGRLRG